MKKDTEKQPIDDLFAQKLGNMSLKPSPDAFERLQARMSQGESKTRLTIWRNPAMQRYMAVAACLLLVCLFGWLYRSTGNVTVSDGASTAAKERSKKADPIRLGAVPEPKNTFANPSLEIMPDVLSDENQQQVAAATKETEPSIRNERTDKRSSIPKQMDMQNVASRVDQPKLAQEKTIDLPTKSEAASSINVTPTPDQTTAQVAVVETKASEKSTRASERGLVVTIEEPATLIAARQAAKAATIEEKPVVAVNDKSEKEEKSGSLWQQVKRLKQGDLFARHDVPNDEDRGLLERAYSGLKNGIEKEKSKKQ